MLLHSFTFTAIYIQLSSEGYLNIKEEINDEDDTQE